MICSGRFFGVLLGLIVIVMSPPADAQDRSRLDQLFRSVLQNPSDPALTLRYAALAEELGEYEPAISALERLLLADPDQPKLKLDLARLYERMNAHGQAKLHLAEALESGRLSEADQQEARALLVAIEGQEERHQFTGTLTAGLRYQTNATAGIDNDVVRAGGRLVSAPNAARRRDDTNAFLFGFAQHELGLRSAVAPKWITNGIVFATRYAEQPDFSATLLEATTGPSLRLAPTAAPGFRIRPYAIAGVALPDNRLSQHTLGGGAETFIGLGPRTTVGVNYEVRDVHNDSHPEDQLAGERSGVEQVANISLSALLDGDWALVGAVRLRDADREKNFYDFFSAQFDITVSRRVDAPFKLTSAPWVVGMTALTRDTAYSGPDPTIDPSRSRRDRTYGLGLSNTVPLNAQLTLVGEVRYETTDSNILNYSHDNIAVQAALTWKF